MQIKQKCSQCFSHKASEALGLKVSFINKEFCYVRRSERYMYLFYVPEGVRREIYKVLHRKVPPLPPYPFVRHFDRKATHFVYLPLNKGIPVTIFQNWTCIMNESPKTEIFSLSCSAYQIKRYSQKVHLFKIFYFKALLNN